VPTFLYGDPGSQTSDSRPCFDATGDKVVFMREVNGGPASLWTVDVTADGSATPAQLFPHQAPTSSNNATRPDWSWHDGRIAFSGNHTGDAGLFVIQADGTQPQHVAITVNGTAVGGDKIQYPAWYPGGTHIAVTDYNVNRILKVTLSSGHAVAWTDPAKLLTGQSSVNQSATDEICAAAQLPGSAYDQTNNHVWVQTTDPQPYCIQVHGHGHGRAPWWSPSGHFIAFESDYDTTDPSHYAIYLYRVFDQKLTRVTPRDGWSCTHAKFHPTKNRIVVGAHQIGQRSGIAIVDFDVAVVAPL
jgi:Tol biopolymer transport system component